MSLNREVLRRSVLITFLSSNASTVVYFGVTIVLARLLTPAEVGIFSITVVFTGVLGVIRDFGVAGYIVREPDLTTGKIRSALGLLLTSSWILAGCLYLSRDAIASFYGQPGIGDVLRVLTLSFVLVPLASFHYALFARDLRAGSQAVVNVVGAIIYAITSLTLAYRGMSYMALAWANVANIAVTILVFLFLRPKGLPWMPSFRGWKAPATFGSGLVISSLIGQIHNSIPDLVLGRLSGPREVGLYSRANGLVGIFRQIVGPSIDYNAVPFIAKNYNGNVDLAPILKMATSYLTVLAWPTMIMVSLFAPEMIRFLYGVQWLPAAPIVVFIAIQTGIRIGYSLCQPAMIAIGRPYLGVLSSGVSASMRLLIVLGLGIGSLRNFAIAICVADIISLAVPMWLMSRYLGFTSVLSKSAHLPSVKVNIGVLMVALMMRYLLPTEWPDLVVLGCAAIVTILSWVAGVWYFSHPIKEEASKVLLRVFPRSFIEVLDRVTRKLQ